MARPDPTPSQPHHPHWTQHSIHSGFKHPTSQPPFAAPAFSLKTSSFRQTRRLPPCGTLLFHLQQPLHLSSSLLPQLLCLSQRAVDHHHRLLSKSPSPHPILQP